MKILRITKTPIFLVALVFMASLIVVPLSSFSQTPPSASYSFNQSDVDARFFTPAKKDLESVYNADNGKEGLPLKAGFSINVDLKPSNAGSVFMWPDGSRSWIVKLVLPEAPFMALTFNNVTLPEGTSIFVYSNNSNNALAALSSKDIVSSTLSSPMFTGGEVFVEYFEPIGKAALKDNFTIYEIVFIANGIDALNGKDLGDSEACQVNINCPEGTSWQNQKRGVARILFREGAGWYWCSGTLINNTAQDGKPYFLTAEHCGGSASAADRNVWQFYFNYERSTCANTGTPPTNLITGCTLKAKGLISGGSDFQLVELSSTPVQAWNPYYNGWSRSTTGSASGVSIHHPSGDAKKISTYTSQLTSAGPNIGGSQMATNSAWRVVWAATASGTGVTEGGSSGSPIFNADGLVVGTLSGGASTCTNPNFADYYGKFSYHWESNGSTNEVKLAPWLDPTGSNTTTLAGFDPYAGLFADFTANTTQVYENGSVTFTDLSGGDVITSWEWNFGIGAVPETATGQGPHTVNYPTVGQKTVTLTVNGTVTKTKLNYITVVPSIFVAPAGLQAQIENENDVKLTWNYPEIVSNEGFEGFDNFALSFAPWIQHDLDGKPTYTIDGTTFTNQGYTGTFIVFNNTATTPVLSAAWAARTGSKAAVCFNATSSPWNNDWLVSPRIKVLPGYTLKFWAKSITAQYGLERLKVGISTTGSIPANFTIVSAGTYLSVPVEWTEYTYSLAAYEGSYIHFAFNCVSADAFALFIDDISVTDASGKSVFAQGFENDVKVLDQPITRSVFNGVSPRAQIGNTKDMMEISGYKIFRNEVEIATISDPDILEYNDLDLPDGEYSYTVSATYSSPLGQSVTSEPATVVISTGNDIDPNGYLKGVSLFPNPFSSEIRLTNAQKVASITITNILGQVLYSTTNTDNDELRIDTYKLPSGVYMVHLKCVDKSTRVVKMIRK